MEPTHAEQRIFANFQTLKDKRRRLGQDEEHLALEEASLVQQEIRRWQNSIRELEQIIESQHNSDDDDSEEEEYDTDDSDDGEGHPAQPRVVIVVDEEESSTEPIAAVQDDSVDVKLSSNVVESSGSVSD